MKKQADSFKVLGVRDGKLTIELTLEAPSDANRSKGENGERDGKSYVIAKAWGKLPFLVNGKVAKINCNVYVPVAQEAWQSITLTAPPVVPPQS